MNSLPRTDLARGALSVIVGVAAFAWPGITILALVILFAVYAFANAVVEVILTFSKSGPAKKIGRAALTSIDAGAGIIAVVWPGITAYVLVYCIGAWALIGGIGEIAFSLGAAATASEKALLALGGLVTVIFGLLLVARPGLGAFSLAELFAFFAVFYGISTLTLATRVVNSRM